MQLSAWCWISHALFSSNSHCIRNWVYVQVYFQLTDYVATRDGLSFNIMLTYIRIIRIKFNIQGSFHRFWILLVKYNSSFVVSCEIFDVQKLVLIFMNEYLQVYIRISWNSYGYQSNHWISRWTLIINFISYNTFLFLRFLIIKNSSWLRMIVDKK